MSGLRVLVIVDSQNQATTAEILQQDGITFVEAQDCRVAQEILRADPRFDLVICEASLPNGAWCGVLSDLRDTGSSARLLVCAIRGGRLVCGDIVARGGYLAIAPPHEWKPLRQMTTTLAAA